MASISVRSWRRQIQLALGEAVRQAGAKEDRAIAACAVVAAAVGRLVVDVVAGVAAVAAARKTAVAVAVAVSRKVVAA